MSCTETPTRTSPIHSWSNSMDWVQTSSGSWWWTGKPGILQFMRLQRVRHDWAIELNWAAPFIVGKAWKKPIDRWMDKENKGIFPSHGKEWNIAIRLPLNCIILSDYFENADSLDSSIRFKSLTLRIHKTQYLFPIFPTSLQVMDREACCMLWFMGLQSRTRLTDWTELNWM